MFGPHILRLCPTLYEDFWDFYAALPYLLVRYPRWLAPRSWAKRDKMHAHLARWRDWCNAHGDKKAEEASDDVFDPIWGSAVTRRLVRIYEDLGLSDKAISAAILSFFSV
jgi:hypothetical protein